MTGATRTCKRSMTPASIKFDTVVAPPSIKRRRKPRSAKAETMARGEMPPSWAGSLITSSPGRGGASQAWMRMVRTAASDRQVTDEGTRARGSMMTRTGLRPSHSLTVSRGLSAITVPAPTTTASTHARMRWRCSRADRPLIYRDSPVSVAMRPSSDWPSCAITRDCASK